MASTLEGTSDKLLEDPGTACSTARLEEKGRQREQGDPPIAPCPSCGAPVAQERMGGSLRRFCCASCRWTWNRKERRRRLMEAIEAAACSRCREAVLKVIRKGNGGKGP